MTGIAPSNSASPARRLLQHVMLGLAILAGGSAGLLTLGPRILDIQDLGWLLHGTLGPDPVAYLVAWKYFARDSWHWPPGLNPDYGLELASAIFYVDAIPLVAFLAKALRPLLEVPQYWGPWMVLCTALQAGFGWRLLGVAVEDPVARGLGATLLAWQPMVLNRMAGHFALVAQWLILFALWLCLRPISRQQTLLWLGCLGTASLVNAYLLAMTGLLWAADWAGRAWRGRAWQAPFGKLARGLLAQAVLVPAAVVAGLWLAGFFALGGDVAPIGEYYGHTQLDITAPFDASEWGWLLPALPGLRHWEYGGSYLGAGSLLLLAVAALLAFRQGGVWPVLARHWVLLAVLAGFLLFALSNRLGIAGQAHLLFELPQAVAHYADLLRASERFFWPIGYALIFAGIAMVATRLRPGAARWLLALALAVQIVDINHGMAKFRALVAAAPAVAAERLPDPFWAQAAQRYRRVRAVPAENLGRHWEAIARFAAPRGLLTDAAYFSRVDPHAKLRLRARILDELARGDWEPGTLYVLRDPATRDLVAARMDPARDILVVIDGLTVFAPNWTAP